MLACFIVLCGAALLSPAAQPPIDNQPAEQPAAAAVRTPVVMYSTRGDEMVHVLAGDDLRHLGSIDAGLGAHELALDASGRFLMGSAYGGPGPGHQPADNRLVVIDMPARAVHKTITIDGAARPNDIAFAGDSTIAFVTAEAPQHLLRVDASTGEQSKWPLPARAGHMLALSPDARTAYVSHVVPGSVSFVDAATGEVVRSVAVPAGAEGIACSPDGASLWVASNRAGKVTIISTATGDVTRTIDLGGFPFRVRISADGKHAAISAPQSRSIALFDTAQPDAAPRMVDVANLGDAAELQGLVPTSIAFAQDSATLYALCAGEPDAVVAIDVQTATVRSHAIAQGPIADALASGSAQWRTEG